MWLQGAKDIQHGVAIGRIPQIAEVPAVGIDDRSIEGGVNGEEIRLGHQEAFHLTYAASRVPPSLRPIKLFA
jgi:hypothetical protein